MLNEVRSAPQSAQPSAAGRPGARLAWAVIAGLILERRRRCAAELELRQRLMQVVHLNRSAIAGALSASVAHELNQPLATIQNTAEAAILYLKAGPPNTTRIEHLLGNIIRDDNRAAKKIGAICADC